VRSRFLEGWVPGLSRPASGQTCPSGSLDVPPHVSYGAPMAIQAGRHRLGTERGRIVLATLRDGLAAQAGHDLTLEATRWSGELVVGDDLAPLSLEVRIDMESLVVREGTGGLKPLSDRDKREIAATARKVLAVQRHPEASFSATAFEPAQDGGGVITGTLALAGRSRPLRLSVSQPGPGDYRATATIVQSDFGIKPYSGFLGALKVRDAVNLQVDVSLPGAKPGAPA
jgi:polyisoprenoid-binding protein YceI